MKKAWIAACALLFVSAAVFAETPTQPPLTSEVLAAILSEPGAPGSCDTQQSGAVFAARRSGISPKATCRANCDSPGYVECTGETCTALNRNCPNGEVGRVTCVTNSVATTILCTPACPTCNTGTIQERRCCQCDLTGDCMSCCRCDGGTLFQCSEACS